MPGIVCSERGALPTCPLHAWQAAACKAWRVLHAGCIACCILPLLLWRGAGWVAASPPFMCLSQGVLLGLCKVGCCSFPPCCMEFWKGVFLSCDRRQRVLCYAALAAWRCLSRGFARCTWCSLDLFSRKLTSQKRTGWPAWCGAG